MIIALVVRGTDAFGALADAPTRGQIGAPGPGLAIPVASAAVTAFARKGIANLVEGAMGVLRATGFAFVRIALAVPNATACSDVTKRGAAQIVFNHQTIGICSATGERLATSRSVAKLAIAAAAVIDANASACVHVASLIFTAIFVCAAKSVAALFRFAADASHRHEERQNKRFKEQAVGFKSETG